MSGLWDGVGRLIETLHEHQGPDTPLFVILPIARQSHCGRLADIVSSYLFHLGWDSASSFTADLMKQSRWPAL